MKAEVISTPIDVEDGIVNGFGAVDGAQGNNERMDKVVEQENETQNSRRQAETGALELIRPELLRVFPNDCQRLIHHGNGNITSKPVSQEDLVKKFLETRSDDVRKYLLRKKLENVANEIFSFFLSGDFTRLLGLKTDEEKKKEKDRVAGLLRKKGLNQWSNRTDLQEAGDGAKEMISDLEDIRGGGSVIKKKDAFIQENTSKPGDVLEDDDAGVSRKEGGFGSPDYIQAIDDQAEEGKMQKRGDPPSTNWGSVRKDFDEETERLKTRDKFAERFRDVKSFDELLVLLNDPEFPGIQGSQQFYSGEDLRRIVMGARETGATKFVTRSHGFLETVERLLRQEKEGRIGAIKEDDIVESLGVVVEKPAEVVFEEEIRYESEEPLSELRARVETLKRESDESRDRYFVSKYKNEEKWRGLKKYFSFLRSKEFPPALVNELESLKQEWNYKLTLYKDARLELVKLEMDEEVSAGRKKIGDVNAEALQELEFRNRVETRDAWMSVSLKEKGERAWYDQAERRAHAVGEWYRALPWQEKLLITAGIVGVGVAGAAVGSSVLVGTAALADIARRALGGYVAKFGLSHGAESWNRKQNVAYNEAAIENVRKIEDENFLEQNKRIRNYADIRQKEFEQMASEHLKREQKSAVAGLLLFGAGTAYAYRDAIQNVAGQVSRGFSKLLEQMKIITGFEDFHEVPVSVVGAPVVDVAPQAPPVNMEPSIPDISGSERSDVLPNTAITRLVLEGSAIEAASDRPEIVPHLSNNFPQTPIPVEVENVSPKSPIDAVVVKGSSIQGTLIEHFKRLGFSDADAGKFASRVSDAFQKDHPNVNLGKVFENTKIHFEPSPGSSGPLSAPFKIEGIEFAPSGPHGTPTIAGTMMSEKPVEPTFLQPKPPDVPAPPPTEAVSPPSFPKIPEVNLESPQDILDRVLPKVSAPSLEDALKGNFSPEIPSSVSGVEAVSATPLPQIPLESLDLSVSGSEYLKNMGMVVKEKLTFLPLSQGQKDLIESIFSARIPVPGTEPTPSSVLFVRDALRRALFPLGDVAPLMRAGISEDIKKKVSAAAYAGIVRIGGDRLRIGNMIANSETVMSWLTKMAKHILTHPVEK